MISVVGSGYLVSIYTLLINTMRPGVQGGGMGFDAPGADSCGLLRLLLRYNRCERARVRACVCACVRTLHLSSILQQAEQTDASPH
jgi:hypothetical protein